MNACSAVVTLVVLVVAIACSGREPAAPDEGAFRLTETHTLGEPVVVGNLTVWPVFTDEPVDLGDFTTLEEALGGGTAEVREVGGGGGPSQSAQVLVDENEDGIPDIDIPDIGIGQTAAITNSNEFPLQIAQLLSDGATVGTLLIENKGDVPLLVCAGTIVTGGNQDRQIGEDVIIEAKATVPVEAYCVEQGRWTAHRMGIVTEGKFAVAAANATKDVRAKGQYLKRQGEVWDEVAATKAEWRRAFREVESSTTPRVWNARIVDETTSLAVVLDANEEVSGKELAAIRQVVKDHFAKHGDAAVGFAYAVDGRVVTVRAFLNPALFAKQFDPFLASMVTEAWIARRRQTDAPPVAGRSEDVVALVRSLEGASEKMAGTRGGNLNGVRINDAGYTGSCYLPVEGGRVAVTRDWTSK